MSPKSRRRPGARRGNTQSNRRAQHTARGRRGRPNRQRLIAAAILIALLALLLSMLALGAADAVVPA